MEPYEKSGVQGFSLPIHYTARPRLTMSRTVLLLNAVKATPAFDSKNLGAGQSWRFVMQKKGHFNYACAYHPSMLGVLMVQ